MSSPLLQIINLSFSYNAVPVLRGLNLEIAAGEALAIHGVNGSGKTTLFRCITGLEKAAAGELLLNGEEIRTEKDFQKLRRSVGYSLQDAEDQLIFPTVIEDVSFGPLNLGFSAAEAQQRAQETLASLGIGGLAHRLAGELSGGQQKLAALAAVLAMRPQLLLLDEPFNALDAGASQRVAEVISGLPCAKIIVAHDSVMLERLGQKQMLLENGRLRQISG